ncbi:MAG: glycosyltransferase family 2 protein [Candidatus Methylumidiphilus sp.]
MKNIRLSLIVISYNMSRELPRTIKSLSPAIQRGIDKDDYEIIVVDNGSKRPLNIDSCEANLCIEYMPSPHSVSPAAAVNRGLEMAKGEIVGVLVDGARMASPGLLAKALKASKLHHRPVIAAMGFHLGPENQSLSAEKGYNQEVEDKLLQGIRWEEDAYRLFDVSVFAGSSSKGWFMPMSESNALFLPRSLWKEIAGFDEQFVCRGGGLVNLDTYKRCCDLDDNELIVLLGEGTFHQFHGGASANAKASQWSEFHQEYVRIRGEDFSRPQKVPLYVGNIPAKTFSFMSDSISKAQGRPANFVDILLERFNLFRKKLVPLYRYTS